MVSRRNFLKLSAAMAAAVVFPLKFENFQSAYAAATNLSAPAVPIAPATPVVTPFVDPLIAVIPKLAPAANPAFPGADYYEINMSEGSHKFHSQFPGFARTLRYGSMPYLGPTIEAQQGRPVVVKFINNLPPTEAEHPLAASIDPTVPDPMMYNMGLDSQGAPIPLPGGRATPHLHGGFTLPEYDGHPHSWVTPDGLKGSYYASLPGAAANEMIYTYPNAQPAAPLWYHDHAMGITRLNVYAGLAGLYFVRDAKDTGLTNNPLRLPAGAYEVPLVLQDKSFNADGSLFFDTVGITDVHQIWVPEFFGDTPVVNAVAYPYLKVEPRRYRFRVYNGSQARFYNLSFQATNGLAKSFYVIGMEQGLLPAAVQVKSLLLAPGERADIIFDFTQVGMGKNVILANNAAAPYPAGELGQVPQLMQFRVNVPLKGRDGTLSPENLKLTAVPRLVPTAGAPLREVVMRESMDPASMLPIDMRLNSKWFDEPVDENPRVGTTEIWQYINLTVDAHPMHMHLVKFQVYNRQAFDAVGYTASWDTWVANGRDPATKPVLAGFLIGLPLRPGREEMGWKDTVKALPGQVTRVIARFDVPAGTVLPAEYVYHCHILEHEENEMMRPFTVVP